MVERVPDDKRSLTYQNLQTGADGSVVERVPDKNKVEGSIPSRPTEMDFLDRREWRSPRLYPEEHRGPPWRALQSPVYIRKKPAVNKREKEKRKNFVAVITQFVS